MKETTKSAREKIMDLAEEMYLPLLKKVSDRFFGETAYTVSDTVGFECTRIEEVFRPLWGIAPLLNERNLYIDGSFGRITAAALITKIILEGTSKDSPRRFDRFVADKVSFANQAVTEAAAYLTAAFFAKEKLWIQLSKDEKRQIADFISRWSLVAIKDSWPNNHYWYPIICLEILKRFGFSYSEADGYLKEGYKNLDALYVDKGWYADGTFGRFDYYHAWAHHTYTLLWILIADKTAPDYRERAERYKARTEEYIKFYLHFFDSDGGMAAYGRSLSYRFAAVSIFSLAAAVGCKIDYGVAKTVVMRNIEYFFKNSIPTPDGTFPVGYLYEADGFGESYQSEGASCCYCQGFMCLLSGEDNPLWKSDEKPLPIEKGDYKIAAPLKGVEILLCGENHVGGVTLFNNSIHYYQDAVFGHKFSDMSGLYGKFAYNSRAGFGISTRDLLSGDNTLSLITPDGRMFSERSEILAPKRQGDVMVSAQIPFSNDPETTVKTYLLPLCDGWHIRVHILKLSRPYLVAEGGFSIGFSDDSHAFSDGTLTYKNYVSRLVAFGLSGKVSKAAIAPGMHLLKPQAAYPQFVSEALSSGTHVLAVAVGFSTAGTLSSDPKIEIKENGAEVRFKEKTYRVDF